MADEEIEELRCLVSMLYSEVSGSVDLDECLEPTGHDDACPSNTAGCEWHVNEMRNNLRLGVKDVVNLSITNPRIKMFYGNGR